MYQRCVKAAKYLCKTHRCTQIANNESVVRTGRLQSMPSSSIDNCARVNEIVPLSALGQMNRMRQRKYRIDGLELWVLGRPSGGRQFSDALDGNIAEAGKDSSQIAACR